MRSVFKKAQKTLCEELHRFGINLRYLGLVRQCATSDELRKVILVEMISRVLKINLRKRWRQQMEKFPSSETESFKHVTAKYMNLALGTSDKSSLYWAFELIPQLMNKFKDALTKSERTDSSRKMASDNHLKRFVLLRMSLLCGISFSPKFLEKLHEDSEWFNQERPIPELRTPYSVILRHVPLTIRRHRRDRAVHQNDEHNLLCRGSVASAFCQEKYFRKRQDRC